MAGGGSICSAVIPERVPRRGRIEWCSFFSVESGQKEIAISQSAAGPAVWESQILKASAEVIESVWM